jgi:hypothetical protein
LLRPVRRANEPFSTDFNRLTQTFSRELTELLPWFIAPAFAAEAATLIVERTVEPRREVLNNRRAVMND